MRRLAALLALLALAAPALADETSGTVLAYDRVAMVIVLDDKTVYQLSDKTEVLFRGHGPGRGLFLAAADLPTLLNRIERIDLSAAVMLAAGR